VTETASTAPALLDSDAAVEALLDDLAGASELAIDSEGDGYHRYRAQLCVLQIATDDEIALVDGLAVDLRAFRELLGPDGPVKILHDAGYDARMLHAAGVPLGNVFDTALAARFLAAPATGLGRLLEERLGVKVDKGHTLADWGRRPLADGELAYLEDDVRHLAALAALLREEVAAADIALEVEEETRYVLAQAAIEEPVRPPWLRIKGAGKLRREAQARLRALAAWREEAAEARDFPPTRLVHDKVLLAVAERPPRSRRELKSRRGARKLADAFDVLVSPPPVPEEERAALRKKGPPPEVRAARRRRKERLEAWRRAQAEERGVDLQVVLPGHCLRDLVDTDDEGRVPEVPGLGAFRLERYGEGLLAAWRGADEED
jgi:ribonuclease D